MFQVDVANNQHHLSFDSEILRSVVRHTLNAEQVTAATISIAIVDSQTMHTLNRKYLNHDYDTDVLSFLLDCSGGESDDRGLPGIPRGTGKTIDGEVIVNSEYAIRIAPDFGWEPLSELILYVIHGLLHLCGYDDLTRVELPVMRQREREILALINLEQPATVRPSTHTSARRDT
ncbi:MAG: rRNA maturation RNase YbeY [Planctomycetaceae bacterium]